VVGKKEEETKGTFGWVPRTVRGMVRGSSCFNRRKKYQEKNAGGGAVRFCGGGKVVSTG